jgi:hypothetical protein
MPYTPFSIGEEMLFIFAGLAWCGLLLIFLAVWMALNSIRTPKPTDWKFKYTETAPPVRTWMRVKKG